MICLQRDQLPWFWLSNDRLLVVPESSIVHVISDHLKITIFNFGKQYVIISSIFFISSDESGPASEESNFVDLAL